MSLISKKVTLLLIFLFPIVCSSESKMKGCDSNIGVNVSGINYYSSSMPYANLEKMSMGWIRPWGSEWGDVPLDVDEKGYLKTVDAGKAQTIIHDDNWGRLSDDNHYVLLYDGQGELIFNLNKPQVINNEPGRIEFKLAKGRLGMVQNSTNKEDPLRNIRIIPKENENNYTQYKLRNEFVSQWNSMGVFRFLDLQAINNSNERSWEGRNKIGDFGTGGAAAIEDIIELSNEMNTNPWLLVPHMADDNYIRSMAEYVKKNLKPNLKVYIEYTNEAWNFGFKQAQYLKKQADEKGIKNYEAYAIRSLELFKIWEGVFPNKNRLVRVISTQFVNSWLSERILETTGVAEHVDALAVGYYFGGEIGSVKMVEETMSMSDGEVFDYLETVSLPATKEYLIKQKEVADQYQIELIAYEAGQHLVGVGKHTTLGVLTNYQELTDKLTRLNRHPRMKQVYLDFYKNWESVGGGLITWFTSIGKYSKWGSWGLLENMGQNPEDAPKYQALQNMIQNEKCL